MAKVLFSRSTYGIAWIFADILEVFTTVSSEKNVASKVTKLKPRIRVAQAFADYVSTSRRSDANINASSGHNISSSSNKILSSITEKSNIFSEGNIIIIESPIYTDIAYARQADVNDIEIDLVQIVSQTGYLSVVATNIKPIQDTAIDKLQLPYSSSLSLADDKNEDDGDEAMQEDED